MLKLDEMGEIAEFVSYYGQNECNFRQNEKKINHNNVVIYWPKCVYLHYVINGNTHSDTPHGKNSNLNNAVFMCFC